MRTSIQWESRGFFALDVHLGDRDYVLSLGKRTPTSQVVLGGYSDVCVATLSGK